MHHDGASIESIKTQVQSDEHRAAMKQPNNEIMRIETLKLLPYVDCANR